MTEFVSSTYVGDAWTITLRRDGQELVLQMTEGEVRNLTRELAGDLSYTLCDGYCHEYCGSND